MLNKFANRYLLILFGIIMSFGFALNAKAADPTIHAVSGGGNWNSAATWTEGRTPTSTDVVEIHGTVRVTGDASIAGLIVVSGANLQNQNNVSPRLTVNGEVVNSGTIQNRDYSTYVLYLTVTGNITNNGTWKNAWTDLASTQSRTIGGTTALVSPVTFLDDFEILNSPNFNGLVNFNEKTITISSSTQSITLKANTGLSGTIAGQGSLIMTGAITVTGTTTANTIIFDTGNLIIDGGSFTANNIIARGNNTSKSIKSDTVFNGPLNVNTGAIIQNTSGTTPRLTINGSVVNNGIIRNQLYLTISGNITNNLTWSNIETDLASTQSRTVDGTSPISGYVSFLENIEFLNSPIFGGGVNFNDKTITVSSSTQSITVKGSSTLSGMVAGAGSLIIADSPTITGTTTASTIIFAAGSPIFTGSFTADNIIIRGAGTKLVTATTTEFHGSLNVESGATLQNNNSVYTRLIVSGDVVNNGVIKNNTYRGLYLTVPGNITNNGTWSNAWTDLVSNQSRTIDGSTPISGPVTFLDDFEILNSPSFNGLVNFNNTITLSSSAQSLTLRGNTTLAGGISGQGSLIFLNSIAITGTTTANTIIFGSGEMTVEGNFTANNIIIRGSNNSKNINADTIFNGMMTVEAAGAIQNKNNVSPRLTVNGRIINNGTIRNSGYPSHSFYVTVTGDVMNNGTWNNTETDVTWPIVLGATDYQFNIATSTSAWPTPTTVATNSFNVSSHLSTSKYWRTRANLGGLYSPWSNIRGINVDLFSGFTFSTIDSSSQMATKPINLTISAVDINGDPYDYSGTVNLSASNNGTTTPSSITMTSGTWTGTTSIAIFGNNVTLTATGNGGSGTSNTFNLRKKPVIIVPGIVGSRLKSSTTDAEIWPNLDAMVLSGDDDYLDALMLNNNGWPATSSVVTTGDIIRKITIIPLIYNIHFFDNLIEMLENNGYAEDENLFVFPYDWRLDIAYTADNVFNDKIQEVKNQTGATSVDVIAHSMGGLVVKRYINDYVQNSIDKFIDIATPHLGAPKAAKILLYGDSFDIDYLLFGINEDKINEISQNFPSVYQLLPSPDYHLASSTVFASYLADSYDVDNNSITGDLDYNESLDYLVNMGANSNLIDMNADFYSDLENFNSSNHGVSAYNIVGCNLPTIGSIEIINHYGTSTHEYGLHYTNGDGTVPLGSANSLDSIGTYFNYSGDNDAAHAKLPSFGFNRELITDILSATSSNFAFNQLNYEDLSQNINLCTPLSGWEVSYHSPIALHIYDEQGRHIGPDANGNIEINIPGAAYDVIGDNKFAFVPKGHNYKVTGQATGLGHFNARIQDVQNGETISTAYYNEVPIKSLNTNIEIDFVNNKPNYEMKIDQMGDKVFKEKIRPNAILNAKESADRIKPETKAEISGQTIKLTSKDDDSKILKTEYSLDSGKTWNLYTKPIDISQLNIPTIQYRSTDRAGNIEIVTEQDVYINKDTRNINLSGARKLKF